MLIDYADTFLTEEDVKNLLSLPVLGFIPIIPDEELRLIRDVSTFSPLMETYRWLRTNLRFLAEPPLRTLLVTSAFPAEGKSTASANLAMSMARDGKKVVLVDADLRRPTQATILQMDPLPGLSDVLLGSQNLLDTIRPTVTPNFSVIFAGTTAMNPTEILGSEAMVRLLAELKELFDIVIIDSSPALAVPDAMLLSSLVDGVLILIAQRETRKSHALKAIEYLLRARANVLGAVFTNVAGNEMGFFFGKYYVPSVVSASD